MTFICLTFFACSAVPAVTEGPRTRSKWIRYDHPTTPSEKRPGGSSPKPAGHVQLDQGVKGRDDQATRKGITVAHGIGRDAQFQSIQKG